MIYRYSSFLWSNNDNCILCNLTTAMTITSSCQLSGNPSATLGRTGSRYTRVYVSAANLIFSLLSYPLLCTSSRTVSSLLPAPILPLLVHSLLSYPLLFTSSRTLYSLLLYLSLFSLILLTNELNVFREHSCQ